MLNYLPQETINLDWEDKQQWWERCKDLHISTILFRRADDAVWKPSRSYDKRNEKPSRLLQYKIPDDIYTEHLMPAPAPKPKRTKIVGGIPVTTRTIEKLMFINNEPASDMSDDRIINEIAEAEDEIEQLQKMSTESKKIKAKLRALKSYCKKLAAYLDNR